MELLESACTMLGALDLPQKVVEMSLKLSNINK